MKITTTPIPDLLIIEPNVFHDDRGYFFESYNESKFIDLGFTTQFKQDNISRSTKNVLRGLHFQKPPYSQGKLVQVLQGSVLDVAVDIRTNSKTFGQHFKIELSEKNNKLFYIPPGFAHGFLTLEDNTIFSYKCTNVYNKDSEDGLLWNDEIIGIDWGTNEPLLSEKDVDYVDFKSFTSPF
jgi:dTDP-4-dehydrorhamnose 3,5-epimerase